MAMQPQQTRRRFRDALLEKMLPDRLVVYWLFFWARFVLRIRKPLIVGVTGSAGKTTTTQMIAEVLMHRDSEPFAGLVWKTAGNMNDDTDLPLTVLGYRHALDYPPRRLVVMCSLPFRAIRFATTMKYPDILVLEYGAAWGGHLQWLAKLAPPKIAVVTTIGPAHLERLKTIEGVIWEKGALVRAVTPPGLVVLGDDHAYVSQLEQQARVPVLKVKGRGRELSMNITRAVCRHLGIPEPIVASVLDGVQPLPGRLNHLELTDLTVIDDAYNANPLSMKLGLDMLAETARPGQRRLAVLGFMAELGDASVPYHQEIGAHARSRADIVIGVGGLAKHYDPDHWFNDSEACAAQIEALVQRDDRVLVKGSNSARMDRIVVRLREIAGTYRAP